MARKKDKIPDAWDDDDWEAQADRIAKEPEPEPEAPQVPVTRAERLAKHAEDQRKLWESAEAPSEEVNFLPPSNNIPLATAFKPALKLLSRKPAPQGDDDEEDDNKKDQPTPEEVRLRQQREREEKQRRYNEARARIFEDSNLSSGQSSPGNVTPPQSSEGRQSYRGRGRGRGGRGAHNNDNRQDNQSRRLPANQQPGSRELFDPSYSPRAGFNVQRRGGDGSSSTPREEDQIIRTPRGPDGGAGFGFSRRGGTQEG
ncbi:hypothetical protein B0H63DRAFT_21992 [Podospora didyma]|uniref:SUZ domain-containing protein n=1 Tax=Podospora didyma TaxID=330526 RepID=A0AAE0P5B6_9PEZI|nr:hypothetical protein B0H63DRAFT_21992 [Podospora didyma]